MERTASFGSVRLHTALFLLRTTKKWGYYYYSNTTTDTGTTAGCYRKRTSMFSSLFSPGRWADRHGILLIEELRERGGSYFSGVRGVLLVVAGLYNAS